MKPKSGIYRIVNIINGKGYVGKAQNFHVREKGHFRFLRNNNHHSILLQRAYNKYGKNNFKFEILEYVEDFSKLFEREQYWIDFYDAANPEKGYNIYPFSIGPLGVEWKQVKKNKKEILEFCKRNKFRPSTGSEDSFEVRLGESLYSYIKFSHPSFDEEFRKLILVYPSSRLHTTKKVKQEILNFIKKYKYLPSRHSQNLDQKRLGKILSYIKLKNNILYDPSFIAIISDIPTFKQFNIINSKAKLKEFVIKNGYIPSSKSKDKNEKYLGKAWYHFSDKNRKCYDLELIKVLSSFPKFGDFKKVLI